MLRLPTLTNPHPDFGPLFRLSLRLRLAASRRRGGAVLRLLAGLLHAASPGGIR